MTVKVDVHKKLLTRDGPIQVSVSEISAYRHFLQYQHWQAKKVANTSLHGIGSIGKGQYRHIGKNVVSAHLYF